MSHPAVSEPLESAPPVSRHSAGVLVELLNRHRGTLAVAAVISLVAAGLNLAQPLVVNRIIDTIGQGPVGMLVAGLTLLVVLTAVVEASQQFIMTRTAESAVLGLRRSLIARILRLPISVHDTYRSGDLVSRLGADTTLVRAAFTGGLVEAFGGMLVLIGAVVAMALLDTVMLLIVLTVGVGATICVLFASTKVQHLTTAAQDSVGDLGANLQRALSAIRTIRASRAEPQIEAEIGEAADTAYSQGVRIARIESVLWPISGLALQVAFLAVLGIGGARVATGDISVADLVTFVLFLFLVAMPLSQVFSAIITVRSAVGALQRVHQVLDLPAESDNDRHAPTCHPRAQLLAAESSSAGSLVVEDVSFGYEPGSPVLTDVSFRVPAGTTTALVGPSGSGKSTVLALIERFYEPDAGRIMINGTDISTMGRDELRSQIGYVEQIAPVLAGTVRDNLTLGASHLTDTQCEAVLDKVNLRNRFRRASGLDTVLGERGVNLSGGERQRLAIARVLLSNASLLLLDEPTASVDSHNEALIHSAITAAAADRSVIVVAHRLSTVTSADEIVVLEDGAVRARGTHTDLMSTSPLYQDLAQRQLLT